jgi:uroporphyrin-3 C-methyltransferase
MSDNSNTDEPAGSAAPAQRENEKSAARKTSRNEPGKASDASDRGSDVAANDHSARAGDAGAVIERGGSGAATSIAVLALLVALAAAGFAGWQGYELQRKSSELDSEVANKLARIESIGSDSRKLSSDARDIAQDLEARLGKLEARIVGIEAQRQAMESLYDDLAGSRDQWTIAEVEQTLLVANQQLQLAANAKAALTALEAADARLAQSDRPQFTQLRRVIEQDIERLKSSPLVDVTGIGLKLERIIGDVDALPLAMAVRPNAQKPDDTADASGGGWRGLAAEIWHDLSSLVRIERVDSSAPPLLAPDQTYFLRENLKLRLLSARLALLGRDQQEYKADLEAASTWLKRYFDVDSPTVASSLKTLNELETSNIVIELPDITASLDAVRKYRLLNEHMSR